MSEAQNQTQSASGGAEGGEPPPRRSAAKGREGSGSGQLNLTPMLDVAFQLLIFFVLTASFALGEGILPADLPTGQGAKKKSESPPEQPLVIRLSPMAGDKTDIRIEGLSDPLDNFQHLFRQLETWRYDEQSNPDGIYKSDNPVILRPAPGVDWEHVIAAFNACVRAGFKNVNFAEATSG